MSPGQTNKGQLRKIHINLKQQKEFLSRAKYQPWPIQTKLKRVRLAKAYVEKYEGRLSRGHGYQEAGARYWRWFKRELTNLISFFIPWEMRIKRIESHFGSVVASYFTFLRWMFWVNIVLTLITLGFIVVPEILVGAPMGTTPRKSVPEQEKERALNMETVLDWGGYIKYSILFYGYYSDSQVIGNGYRLPLAYFLAGLGTFAISFVIILRKMARNSRLLNLSSQDEQYVFSWKVYTTWDFMIGNGETSKNKSAEISTNFRESISEEQEKKKKQNTKTLIALRVLANFLVCAVIAASTYAIYLLVERSNDVEKRVERGEKVNWFVQNEVSLAMSLITAIFPSIFDLIGLMEKYHPRVNLRWQLARILLLYFMNLYTLLIALYGKVLNLEIAKLAFFDTITTVAMVILIDFIRGLVVRYFNKCCCWDLEKKFPEYGEFKIAENLLHLIYNQATVWMGTFFSPMLPGLNLVKLLIMLYIRSWAVLVCNIPHERVFRASRSNNFYYAITLLMLFLMTLMVGFLLVSLQPSSQCGPFTSFERSYQVFTVTLEEELPSWARPVMDYIASPGIIIPLFLLLAMIIYYLASLTRSLKEANKDLRVQLLYERTEEKRKIYAMADGRSKGQKKDGPSANGAVNGKPNGNHRAAPGQGEGAATGRGHRPVKVVRVPGITPQQAAALKEKNPNLRIITTQEAQKLKILPPPSKKVPQRTASSEPQQQLDVRRLPAITSQAVPPVAVVHGKPFDTRRDSGHSMHRAYMSNQSPKEEIVQIENIV